MEGDPGVRCYHDPMTDSIAIARLNAEVARVVTNITPDVANLEEGGTDPPRSSSWVPVGDPQHSRS